MRPSPFGGIKAKLSSIYKAFIPVKGSEQELRRDLQGWQIFMIVISAVVGTGILHGDSEALEVAGPGGMLLAFCLVGFAAICVTEVISEMTQLFPGPCPFVENVEAFLDPDWAWVIGIAYWYTYASFFATQLVFAASFATYWNLPQIWISLIFYLGAPILLLVINFAGVWHFGWIETIGGSLKICIVLGAAIFLFYIDKKDHIGSEYIEDGIQSDPSFESTKAAAACYVIPTLLYSFLGVEAAAVTAYEARSVKSLRGPSNMIGYFVFALYFLAILGEVLTVSWLDEDLPRIYGAVHDHINPKARTRTIISMAALHANYPQISGLFNGCLMYSSISAANTNLYISSRTLYGLAWKLPSEGPFQWLRGLATVWRTNGVPMFALLCSAIAFIWLLVLQGAVNISTATLTEVMNVTASLCCLIVWASQCLAFIRYCRWIKQHKDALEARWLEDENLSRFERDAKEYPASTYLSGLQPLPAYCGLTVCSAIVLVFSSAAWWSTPVTFEKVAVAYGPIVVLFTLFAISKLVRGRPYVRLDRDSKELIKTLERLEHNKPSLDYKHDHNRECDP